MEQVYCDYCGKQTEFVDDSEVYGTSYGGKIYLCRDCDAYVGSHKHGKLKDKPFGRLANARLREWKVKAHASFDPMWKDTKASRSMAYSQLSIKLRISKDDCHIGMFDVAMCKRVIGVCDNSFWDRDVSEINNIFSIAGINNIYST